MEEADEKILRFSKSHLFAIIVMEHVGKFHLEIRCSVTRGTLKSKEIDRSLVAVSRCAGVLPPWEDKLA